MQNESDMITALINTDQDNFSFTLLVQTDLAPYF